MASDPKHVELGYEIVEITAGKEPGWYYGQAGGNGAEAEKIGPFDSYEEALKHLEEVLFADDED